jgi:hypothetical protein
VSIQIIKHNEIDDKLLNDIVELVGEEGLDSNKRLHTFDYYNWKLKNNPYGSYVVVNYSDKKLMCFITFTAKGQGIHNSNLLFELGDVYVSSKVRGGGCFFRMLRRFHKEFPKVEVYGTPNNLALPTELKIGYKKLDIGIKYSFMPFGIPLFYFLSNNFTFVKYLYKIDLFTRKLNKIIYLFVKDIECKVLKKIDSIDSKSFYSDLFVKDEQYLLWRYLESPEPYRYLISVRNDNKIIYKKILYKNIPLVIIVDHNLESFSKKRQMLKQLLIQEEVFGVFEMATSNKSKVLPKFYSFTVKKIKFITYGGLFNCVHFLAGDGDNV